MAANATHVYWLSAASALPPFGIEALPVAGGSPSVFASNYPEASGLLADDENVYWLTDDDATGGVMVAPVLGGAPMVLVPNQNQPAYSTMDAQFVYWTNQGDGTVMRVPKAGGGPIQVASGQDSPGSIGVFGETICWTTPTAIMKITSGASVPTVLANVQNPGWITVNSRDVYFIDMSGAIFTVPIKGGATPQPLANQGPAATNIAVNDLSIFWTTDTAVVKLAKH